MIIWRYILRAHVGPFLFGTIVIMVLFLLQYMMRWVDQLASKGLDPITIGEFLVLNLSWIVVLAVPIAVLFSTVMAFGSMSAAHEVTIFKASGMGLFKMMIPVVLAASLLWGFVFWYTDNVLPDSNLRLSTMMRNITQTKPSFALDAGQFTTAIEGFTILARRVDSNGVLYGVTIYDNSRADRQNVVNADTGRMGFSSSLTKMVVQLSDGEIHQTSKRRPQDYRVITFERHQITMPADRFFYEQTDPTGSSRSEREMNIADMQAIVDRSSANYNASQRAFDSLLNAHIAYLDGAGLTSTPIDGATSALLSRNQLSSIRTSLESEAYRMSGEMATIKKFDVEIYKKYAIPAACMLFIFVGCPMGILTKGGNFGMSAAISLAFYTMYWVSLIGGEKLADRGLMPTWLAMWMGNIILALIGIFVTIKVNYETTPLRAIRYWFTSSFRKAND